MLAAAVMCAWTRPLPAASVGCDMACTICAALPILNSLGQNNQYSTTGVISSPTCRQHPAHLVYNLNEAMRTWRDDSLDEADAVNSCVCKKGEQLIVPAARGQRRACVRAPWCPGRSAWSASGGRKDRIPQGCWGRPRAPGRSLGTSAAPVSRWNLILLFCSYWRQ